MKNKDNETMFWLVLFLILLLFSVAIVLIVFTGDENNNKRCEKVCNAKGLEFYQWVASSHGDCGCFDLNGDIVYYAG